MELSSNPKVSVIMSVYNAEQTLKKSIDSILKQTYTNWEFIICNDCSNDRTLKIISEYAQKDDRIKVISNKKNKRLAASLNECLKIATGKYIARMDADDECIADRIELQVKFLENNDKYAVVGCNAYINNGEKIVGIRKLKEKPTSKDVLFGPTFMHPTIMMHKEIYDALGGYTVSKRTVRGQDWDLWFRFFSEGYKGYNLQTPLLVYHESKEDMKKRNLKTSWMFTKTALHGYKLLKVPAYMYIFALKPIISQMTPKELKEKRRSRKNMEIKA